ncbi:putative transcriptional regulatory protein [Paramyrothecium foliicola]|nr:putative transcriptional regulatory protein [Paramyrothecium foliicola]
MAGRVKHKDSPLQAVGAVSTTSVNPRDSTFSRSACEECQRRKQKCDRGWPCNHCQKRKVAEKCNYRDKLRSSTQDSVNDQCSEIEENGTHRKRRLHHEDSNGIRGTEPSDDETDSDENGNDRESLEALGYTASHHFVALTKMDDVSHKAQNKRKQRRQMAYRLCPPQTYMHASSCPQLQRALHVLPPRPYTDALVQNFLKNVNFHYYIIYPQAFIEEYLAWWNDRADNRPLGLQWTCLLMMICACSTQYTDEELQQRLENDLSETTQVLTERYHAAARELHGVVPISSSHLLNVQQLLHSCYWYKSEVRFVECWHVLSLAIREAQELGIHHEASSGEMPEFEREMRRRIWCVLDTWDWQISALLSRPMLINRADCDVKLPSLSLETYSPSPLLHMKLQSELIGRLACRFGFHKNVVDPPDIDQYRSMLEDWMEKFPPTYDFKKPDRSQDAKCPWIELHRHYLHTMAFSMTLDPIRAYLTTEKSKASPPEVLKIRNDGLGYALKLMRALHSFFDYVWPRDAKFHFVLFAIFDTASLLCSAIIHDLDKTIPRETDILNAIENAVSMLRRLQELLPSAKISYNLLTKFWKKARKLSSRGEIAEHPGKTRRKKIRFANHPLTPSSFSGQNGASFGTGGASEQTAPVCNRFTASPKTLGGLTPHSALIDSAAQSGGYQTLANPLPADAHINASGCGVSSPTSSDQRSVAATPMLGSGQLAFGLRYTTPSTFEEPVEGSEGADLSNQAVDFTAPTQWRNIHPDGALIPSSLPTAQSNGAQPDVEVNTCHCETCLVENQNLVQHVFPDLALPASGNHGVGGFDELNFDLTSIMENEASSLAQLWDWRGLDLEFLPSTNEETLGKPF